MSDKKPDNVADNPGLLPYASNVGAPSIKPEEVSIWKIRGAHRVNSELKAKYEELKAEFQKLMEEYKWNDLIYHAQYSFEPVNGYVYHLYVRDSGELFLSLISPIEWNKKHVGSFQLDSKDKWIKIDYETNK